MSGIVIDHSICTKCEICIGVCPFGALEMKNGQIEVNAACRVCKICIEQCPVRAISLQEDEVTEVDKDAYQNILVYVEHVKGKIHPVTIELIGKALEMAAVVKQKVNCIFIGSDILQEAEELLAYGVNNVYVYDKPELEYFRVDNYANMFEDCIEESRPACVLVGATTTGRSLAPRVATRFRTGLTADCTILEMRENTDLVQIRPAFGGNIMAQILTTSHRPQFATVRYKVMDPAVKVDKPCGAVVSCKIEPQRLESKIKIHNVEEKKTEVDISNADIIIVAGNGVKDERGYLLCAELAEALGGTIAVTRPLVEKNYASYLYQIGLSGRTVKPKLIVCCGVSGAIQFTAGMNNSDVIIAINSDPEAAIFNVAHYALVGDLYEVIPQLLEEMKGGQ